MCAGEDKKMRRKFFVSVMMGSVFVALACGQAPPAAAPASTAPAAAPAPAPPEDVSAVITQLERDWVEAIIKKDTATIDRLLAPEFNGTSPTAHTFPKEAAIEDLKSGTFVVESMTLDDISVNPYGNTAVAFTSQEEKSHYGKQNTSGHYHWTDVWVKKDGQWQCVAAHGTRYDKGH